MSSKALIFRGLLFAIVVLFSSEEVTVTATDVKSKEAGMETGEVDDVKRQGFGGGHPRFLSGLHGCRHRCCSFVRDHCVRCCRFAGEAVDGDPQAKPNN